jgi:hypothetical protein
MDYIQSFSRKEPRSKHSINGDNLFGQNGLLKKITAALRYSKAHMQENVAYDESGTS